MIVKAFLMFLIGMIFIQLVSFCECQHQRPLPTPKFFEKVAPVTNQTDSTILPERFVGRFKIHHIENFENGNHVKSWINFIRTNKTENSFTYTLIFNEIGYAFNNAELGKSIEVHGNQTVKTLATLPPFEKFTFYYEKTEQ
ncbi:hypothetical protein CRE_08408 [Caenorhabditis remanei]|uniref:Uncharacterized protein n=1 Tax=Caenorhabditis remanei TaxID=31234 RepID=E3MPK9_CAERE|nr:hypothetical protein CRE_08408 [Caenorhabditis remanei]